MNVVVAVVVALSPAAIETGVASQYSSGIMEQVVANRQAGHTAMPLPATLPPVDGFIAVLDCTDVGELWLVRVGGGEWGLYLVADCAGDAETVEWMVENNVLLEFGHASAERLGIEGRGVEVEVVRP